MRRLKVAPEHKKFFQRNGYITFEELVSSIEMQTLLDQIQKRRSELPGFHQENLFRSLPNLLSIAGKTAEVAAQLIERKPLRIAYDCFLESFAQIPPIQEREVGLLLSFKGKGLFFTDPSYLYNEKEACYLLLIFTANYVNNPVVYK